MDCCHFAHDCASFENNPRRFSNRRDGGAGHPSPEICHEVIGGNRRKETLVEQAARHRGICNLGSSWSDFLSIYVLLK